MKLAIVFAALLLGGCAVEQAAEAVQTDIQQATVLSGISDGCHPKDAFYDLSYVEVGTSGCGEYPEMDGLHLVPGTHPDGWHLKSASGDLCEIEATTPTGVLKLRANADWSAGSGTFDRADCSATYLVTVKQVPPPQS